jgi:predicted CoA-substrate-specific enzyme activase
VEEDEVVGGIDVGSQNVSALLLGPEGVLGYAVLASAEEGERAARRALAHAMALAHVKDPPHLVVATGCGRDGVRFATKTSSEVVCQARGAHWLYPQARTLLNLGAESSRAIRLQADGRPAGFVTNDKCAAGCGRFLELIARLLEVPLEKMGELALSADGREAVSSRCAVFAESEVVSHVHRGVPRERILAGVHAAVADRIVEMAARVGVERELAVTGGLALNPALLAELRSRLGVPLLVPSEPRVVGALGAALAALTPSHGLNPGLHQARHEGASPHR